MTIDRREFVRRFFALGAGFTAAGILVRQTLIQPSSLSGRAQLVMLEQERIGYIQAEDLANRFLTSMTTPGAQDAVELAMRDQALWGFHNDFFVFWDESTNQPRATYESVRSVPWSKKLQLFETRRL